LPQRNKIELIDNQKEIIFATYNTTLPAVYEITEIFELLFYSKLAAIFFDVIILPLSASRFLPTFSMLFSRSDRPENHHKTLSCNFFGSRARFTGRKLKTMIM